MMLFHFYLRNGRFFAPTVAKTKDGFYLDVEPVYVCEASSLNEIKDAAMALLENGNPMIETPSRGAFPAPVVLSHAGVKSWATFEKTCKLWNVKIKNDICEIIPMTRDAGKGFIENKNEIIKLPSDASIQSIVNRIADAINPIV